MEAAKRATKSGVEPFDPDRWILASVIDALKAHCYLPEEIEAPAWLGEDAAVDLAAVDILACRNCLLHIPTRSRLLHTPDFFTLNAVDYDYDPEATAPQWQDFLARVFPNDRQAIDTLHEMQGYWLTADTRYQKAFLFLGPPRAGKGTIGRVTTALIGQENVCSPGLSSLGRPFGAEPLIGKRLAVISDARLSARTDQQPIIELLLAVTGEDFRTIDRKFKPSWHGHMPLRVLMLCNELPSFAESSGTLVSRWIALQFKQSFYGREDEGLTDRLKSELSGILNCALEGLDRLRERRRFEQPGQSAAVIARRADLVNPIGAFLRDECVIAPEGEWECDEAFRRWKQWCAGQEIGKFGSKAKFDKAFLANVPHLKVTRPRDPDAPHGPRPRVYVGLRAKTDEERKAAEAAE